MSNQMKDIAAKLTALLRLDKAPIGIKGYESLSEMAQVAKLRRPKHIHTPCQILGQAMHTGITVGFTADDVATLNCNAICGLWQQDLVWLQQGRLFFTGTWWNSEADVERHHKALTQVPEVKYKGIVASPLSAGRIEPDICIITGSPGALFMLLSGFQRMAYQDLTFPFVGESSCSMTWIKTLYTGEIGFSTPCFAEMRFAGFSDKDMILSMTPADLLTAVKGMELLNKRGLRFPVPPYGIQMDVMEGLGASYDI